MIIYAKVYCFSIEIRAEKILTRFDYQSTSENNDKCRIFDKLKIQSTHTSNTQLHTSSAGLHRIFRYSHHCLIFFASKQKKVCKAFVSHTYNIYEHCKQCSLVIDIDKPTQHVHRSYTEDQQSKQTSNLNNKKSNHMFR